jgi:hypothetical protein
MEKEESQSLSYDKVRGGYEKEELRKAVEAATEAQKSETEPFQEIDSKDNVVEDVEINGDGEIVIVPVKKSKAL